MSADHPFTADTTLRLSSSRQWPGEWRPQRSDVEQANENPQSGFLDRFRVALLHNASVEIDEPVDLDPRALENQMIQATTMEQYTYPMALLSRVHSVPSDDELARLQSVFESTFKHHIFVRDLELTESTRNNIPPYLKFAWAALAAVFSPSARGTTPLANESANSFHTGVHLWIVIVESDNREARLIEAVYASTLLVTYGILTADRDSWRRARGLLCNVVVIGRRLHLTDGYSPIYNSSSQMDRDITMKTSLLTYMLLIDTLQTIHCNSVPNFSVSELFVRMPSSNYPFRKIYDSLTHGYASLPPNMSSREDALLLLIALLNDIIYTQKCYLPYVRAEWNEATTSRSFDSSSGGGGGDGGPGFGPGLFNPFAPLTSQSEYSRLTAMFHHSLTRWERHFQARAGGDIMALCHFVRIQLLCPDLSELPGQVGYARNTSAPGVPPFSTTSGSKDVEIPDKAVDIAWQILDDLGEANTPGALGERRLSIWLPVVVFMSALVVWKKVRWQKLHHHFQGSAAAQGGSLKVLSTFSQELALYPWPCCVEMIEVLETLVRS